MLTRQGTVRAICLAGLSAIAFASSVAGIEYEARRQPGSMPAQWQIEQFAIEYCCAPYHSVADAELGFSMLPNQHAVIRTPDYTFLFETDSKGYPNHEPWPDSPTVVFLGDSMVLGTGVGLEGGFAGLLARLLPNELIVNLGLAGAGPARQVRVYTRFGRSWHPTVVVSCLYLASDFENDHHFLSWLQGDQGRDYDAFRLQLARAQHRKGLFRRLTDRSVTFNWAMQPIRGLIEGQTHPESRFQFADGTETLLNRQALEFATAVTAADDPRVDAIIESLTDLRVRVERSGTRLLVMLIPSKEELFGADPSRTRLNLASHVKARLAAMAMPTLDLYPALQRRSAARAVYYPRDIHLNAEGNQVIAEEFLKWFGQHQPLSP